MCACVCSFLCSDSLLYTSFSFYSINMVFIHVIVHRKVAQVKWWDTFILLIPIQKSAKETYLFAKFTCYTVLSRTTVTHLSLLYLLCTL